jgi:hypothetical protein
VLDQEVPTGASLRAPYILLQIACFCHALLQCRHLTAFCLQGTLVDEHGTTHCEILRKYEQVVAENTTLRFQVQDASRTIHEMQQELEAATDARDIEHDRAEMLHDIVEQRENECAQIASAAEEKQQVR